MKRYVFFTSFLLPALLFAPFVAIGQSLPPASEILEKSLDYHDPDRSWYALNHTIDLVSKRPSGEDRLTTVLLHHQKALFGMEMLRDGLDIKTSLQNGECTAHVNGSPDFTEEQKEEYRLNCEGITRWRDYHGYMLGLPMIVTDPGAILDPAANTVSFMGRDVISLKVTYEPGVGGDTWYFYFDPSTYALIGCRFYHDESKNDGEYLTFDGEAVSGKIKLPKTRRWYYNSNDEFLGEDNIVRVTSIR